jgi:uncharacterized protein with ATP-grasp and redox domains
VNAVLHQLREVSVDDKPPQVAGRVHSTIRRVSGCDDPYFQVKQESNQAAMRLYPRAKELVAAADDPFLAAAKIAVIGNIIDSGVELQYDLKAEIETAKLRTFATHDFERLREAIDKASTVLYLVDNAGEIVFDRLLIEQMKPKKLFVALKAKPMLNDALRADAEFAGIDRLATLLTTGLGWFRAGVKDCSAEFLDAFMQADIIIAKGQGNYEWLNDVKANIFFLLMAKCPVIARDLGVKVGEMVVQSSLEN